MISVGNSLLNRWPRFCSTLWSFDPGAKALVVGIEVEEELLRIDLVTGSVSLQQSLKKPRCMTDMPPRGTHEVRRLNDVVFSFQWSNNPHCLCSNLFVQLRNTESWRYGL